jgi:hypothetical protein
MQPRLNITLFISFIFILCLNYCIKNKNFVPLIKTDFYECHDNQQWDSVKVCSALIGSWMWDSTKCPMSGENSLKENNYQMVFMGNSKLKVYKNNILETEAIWSIQGTNNKYALDTEPFVEKAYGSVFLCKNKLALVNSWVDGCDFFFEKESN